ncbi:MAG TPA: hypothetical protein VMR98_05770, partial [Candidatus Polarisedimenticolaceae bacterium]|nr:hypothetical protein [Candidatus Polarisedimenticolaceae bacterium]
MSSRRNVVADLRSCADWFAYSLLALVILGPLLLPGYILNFDMVFAPKLDMPIKVDNLYALNVLLHVLNWLIPSMIIEKLLLFVIFVLAGVGAHRLVLNADRSAWWGAAFAGLLYMVNPFTYAHFMAGQYLVLAGYALLPWFTLSLWRFVNAPGWRSCLKVVAWAL